MEQLVSSVLTNTTTIRAELDKAIKIAKEKELATPGEWFTAAQDPKLSVVDMQFFLVTALLTMASVRETCMGGISMQELNYARVETMKLINGSVGSAATIEVLMARLRSHYCSV